MAERLHRRVRAQLRLALLGTGSSEKLRAGLERDARRAGLTGVEIDAALTCRSFAAGTAAALAFACALKSGVDEEVAQARRHAHKLGVTDDELQVIAAETTEILGKE
jgi:hypothetical protein